MGIMDFFNKLLPNSQEENDEKLIQTLNLNPEESLIKSPISQLIEAEEQEDLEEDCKNTYNTVHIAFITDLSESQHTRLSKYMNHCMGIREIKVDLHIANILDILNKK